jgi:ribosomal protein S18 acetylase RimI-like enzyme
MDIRRLAPSDAPAYRTLRLRALWEHPEAFTSSYAEDEGQPLEASERRLADGGKMFWGAFESRELCGMVGLERKQRAKEQHKATVVGMYVAAEYAGRGIGQALLEALLAGARQEALQLLVLTVTQGDGPALRLYERAGFRSFGIEPNAIRVDGHPYAKNHMFLELKPTS